MSVLHPVASSADAALNAPLGRAVRESEAVQVAGGPVRFAAEPAGPAFPTRAAALAAYGAQAEERWCALQEVVAGAGRAIAPARPSMADGRRWPAPGPVPRTAWRLIVSYWRVVDPLDAAALEQARRLRRSRTEGMDAATLTRLARQPLRPVRPQQPLDLGLFEVRLPENPLIVVPDE